MKVLNDILNYKNLKIFQDTEMFSFTLDSVLISRFSKFNSQIKTVLDFGTNNAVIPLICSKYTKAKFIGIEIQKKACDIAEENVRLNNLEDKIKIVNNSIQNYSKNNLHKADMVICNPPFFPVNEGSNLNKKSDLLIPARHETEITLEEIIYNASLSLRNGGIFTIVHRAERFIDILNLMSKNNLIVKRIRFVYSKQTQKAKTILIEAVLNGNTGVDILNPLICHNDDDTYTEELKKWFED